MYAAFIIPIPTPIGICRASFSTIGLCELWLPRLDGEYVSRSEPGALVDSAVSGAQRRLAAEFTRELGEYFAGSRRRFDVTLDLSLQKGFTALVLERLRAVPYGAVTTYGELAAACGSPKAARAVGAAMRTNPIPIVIPCHRVIAAGGKIGGYSPGLDVKRRLFEIEGIQLPSH